MLSRFFLSLLLGLVIGAAAGVYLGWGPFPVEYVNSAASNLDQQYKDHYTVLIASGYQLDNDLEAALERLRVLNEPNIPAFVQDVTERYITNSRNINNIQLLVELSVGLGRLTPIMEPYRMVESRTESE